MKHKVLIVEDNEELRALYKEIFEQSGYDVAEAADGQAAVDVALMAKPDAVILDLMLPKQGGLGALRVYRSTPELKDVPVIILTALPNPEYQAQAKDKVQGYFLKTQVKPAEIVAKISEIIGAK